VVTNSSLKEEVMKDTKVYLVYFILVCLVALSGCAVGTASHARVFDSSLDAGVGGFIGDPHGNK
jgi:hypothetical protein